VSAAWAWTVAILGAVYLILAIAVGVLHDDTRRREQRHPHLLMSAICGSAWPLTAVGLAILAVAIVIDDTADAIRRRRSRRARPRRSTGGDR